MDVTILAFGIAKEIFGAAEVAIQLDADASVEDLRTALEQTYPRLKKLAIYRIALNNEYAQDSDTIAERAEVALIPPVSGG